MPARLTLSEQLDIGRTVHLTRLDQPHKRSHGWLKLLCASFDRGKMQMLRYERLYLDTCQVAGADPRQGISRGTVSYETI